MTPHRSCYLLAPTPFAFAFFLPAALLSIVALWHPVEATIDCDCFFGSATSLDPCKCICPAPYLEPYCEYTADQFAKIHVAHNSSVMTDLFPSILERLLKFHYSVPYDSVDIHYQQLDESANAFRRFHSDVLTSRWLVKGPIASQMLNDYNGGSTFFQDILGFKDMDLYKPDISKPGEASEAIKISLGPKSHFGTIWVILLLVLFLIAIVEICFCFSNNTEHCEHLAEMERMYPPKQVDEVCSPPGPGGVSVITIATTEEGTAGEDTYGYDPALKPAATEEETPTPGFVATEESSEPQPPVVLSSGVEATPEQRYAPTQEEEPSEVEESQQPVVPSEAEAAPEHTDEQPPHAEEPGEQQQPVMSSEQRCAPTQEEEPPHAEEPMEQQSAHAALPGAL